MATYLPDAIDIFPQFKAYRPDFNSVERGLMLSDAAYEQGARKLRSMYDSIFSSALQRKDTTEKRDAYLKQISGALKSIASSDLSQIQNTDAAYKLFDPIASDSLLAKDIVFTKTLASEYSKAQTQRNSNDDAVRRTFSEDGVKFLEYQAEDFRNADAETALGMSAPRYVPNVDLKALADKLYKESGLSVKEDKINGGYIWTMKNGEIALPLTQSMVNNMMSSDPAVQDMLRVQAYVQRRDFAKNNALKYGSEEAAERAYMDKILKGVAKSNEKVAFRDTDELRDLKAQKATWDNAIKTKGLGSMDDREKYLSLIEKIKLAEEAAKTSQGMVMNQQVINEADIKSYKNAVDNAVAMANYSVLASSLAKYLAFKNYEVTAKVDQYSLADYRNELTKELEALRQKNRKELEGVRFGNTKAMEGIRHNNRLLEIDRRGQNQGSRTGSGVPFFNNPNFYNQPNPTDNSSENEDEPDVSDGNINN